MLTTRAAWTAGLLCAAAGGVVVLLAPLPPPWDSWRAATCMPDHCFCEAIRPRLVRQPANTLSGAAFLAVAVLVLRTHPRHRGTAAAYRGLFAFAVTLVGAGTMFYHASLTFWGQTADVLGMYLVASFVVLHGAATRTALGPRTLALLYIACNTVLLAGLVALPHVRRHVFAVLVVLAVLLETIRRRDPGSTRPRYFLAAVTVLLAGYVIWLLDLTRRWCAPESWLQGHAVWHIAGAAAALLVFRHITAGTPDTAA